MKRTRNTRIRNRNNKITFYEYLASSVPSDAHFVINEFGNYRRALDKKELESQLKNFVKQFGQNGLNALAEIHPDKELLEINCKSCKDATNKVENKVEKRDIVKKYHNLDGDIEKQKAILRDEQIRNANILIFGGMLLIAFAVIIKK